MTLIDQLFGKTVLFFSVQTFNIEKEIIKIFEKYGAKVTYYDERPSNSVFTKGIIRIRKSIYQKRLMNITMKY